MTASLFDTRFNERVVPAEERAFGVSVTLTRGGNTSAAFTATYSDRVYEVVEDGGVMTAITMRDWVVPVLDYKTTGSVLTPRVGDAIASGSHVFEVQPAGTLPCFELIGGDYRMRIRTKRVS